MRLYYGILRVFLGFPLPIRILFEMAIVLLVINAVRKILIYVFIQCKVLMIFNKAIMGGIRFLVCKMGGNSQRVFLWDDKIGEKGRKIDDYLREKRAYPNRHGKRHYIIKRIFIIGIAFIYIMGILPCLKLEKYIDEYYLNYMYQVSNVFISTEECMARGSENYPPLFKEREPEEEVEEVVNEVEETPEPIIYITLNEATSYANVRNNDDINSESLCIVSKNDQILYRHIAEYDGKRYWLKVTILSQDNIEGWISSNVVDKDIVESLNLY